KQATCPARRCDPAGCITPSAAAEARHTDGVSASARRLRDGKGGKRDGSRAEETQILVGGMIEALDREAPADGLACQSVQPPSRSGVEDQQASGRCRDDRVASVGQGAGGAADLRLKGGE